MTLDNRPVWEDRARLTLPPMTADIVTDVCVVGLGASGLTCAGAILDHGATVVGIDAGPVGDGAAGRNAGFLLAGLADFYHDAIRVHGRLQARAIYRLTLEEIRRIADDTPEAVRLIGSLRIARSADELADIAEHLEALREDGFPAEPWSGPEGEGMLIPTDGAFHPFRRCQMLAERLVARGAALHERSPALEIHPGEVVTPGGRVRCGLVLVTVDGRLERVLPELAGSVRTARLQMLSTAPVPHRFERPVYARYGMEYWQQLADGTIVLGGFRDLAGDAEWTDEATPTPGVQERLEQYLRDVLDVDAPVTHRWAALAAWNHTGLPILGEIRPGVWAAGAYCGTGNALGAVCGRALADLAITGHSEAAETLSE